VYSIENMVDRFPRGCEASLEGVERDDDEEAESLR
jgi:hypothetical protein